MNEWPNATRRKQQRRDCATDLDITHADGSVDVAGGEFPSIGMLHELHSVLRRKGRASVYDEVR